MDSTDDRIIALLQANGRRSNREIAKALGLPEKQVAQRIRQLLATDDMRILAVTDVFAAGFEFMLFIGLEVAQRPADAVAEELAAIPEVLSVMLTMGSCDIELVVASENHASLVEFVNRRLLAVAGIRRIELSLGLQTFKYSTLMGPLLAHDYPLLPMPARGALDATDKAIIAALWSDARVTNQSIANQLGLSESAVRARLAALRHRRILRVTAMRNMRLEQGQIFASIGVEVSGRDVGELAMELAALPGTGFVATVLGRHHILVMGLLGSAGEFTDLLTSRIERLPGVHKVHTSQVMRFVKYDPHWTAILESEEGDLPPASRSRRRRSSGGR